MDETPMWFNCLVQLIKIQRMQRSRFATCILSLARGDVWPPLSASLALSTGGIISPPRIPRTANWTAFKFSEGALHPPSRARPLAHVSSAGRVSGSRATMPRSPRNLSPIPRSSPASDLIQKTAANANLSEARKERTPLLSLSLSLFRSIS